MLFKNRFLIYVVKTYRDDFDALLIGYTYICKKIPCSKSAEDALNIKSIERESKN